MATLNRSPRGRAQGHSGTLAQPRPLSLEHRPPGLLVREFFRDAALVHDKRGSNAALPAVFFVVITLDDLHATPVRHGDCVAVADRVAVVTDDSDLTAS